MLLPEAFAHAVKPECLLAVSDKPRRFVGALSFHRGDRSVYGMRLRVVGGHRRQGIGTKLIRTLIEESRRLGDLSIAGPVDAIGQPQASLFLCAHGFERVSRATRVEADIGKVRDYALALRERIARRKRVPSGTRLLLLAEAPKDQLADLYARHIAHNPDFPVHRMRRGMESGRLDRSSVLMAGDRAVGMLIWELKGDMATVHARVVIPSYQGSAANALLLADAIDRCWRDGGRRVRYDLPEGNKDTAKLIRRMEARVVSAVDRYVLKLREDASLAPSPRMPDHVPQ